MSNEVDLRELAIDRGPTARPRIRTRRHVLTRYVLPLLLLLGFGALVAWASREWIFPARAVSVVPVYSTLSEVSQEGTPLFKAAGWIEPRPTPIRVAALAPGVVSRLLVVEDQPVKTGAPIAMLVKEDAELSHQGALADLDLRKAELDQAQASLAGARTRFEQPVHLEAQLGDSDAALARTQTLLKNLPFQIRRAESDYRALKKDYEGKASAEGVVAAIEIDIAESKAEAARALLEELRDRAKSLEEEQSALTRRRDALQVQLNLLADETKAKDGAIALVNAAKARVEQARVAVAEAKLQLDRMTIESPVDGRIFRLIAHPGTRVGSGMTQMDGHDGSTVVTMYQPDQLQVRVDVRFEDLPRVSLRQPVEIVNPALSEPLVGEVLFISSEADIQKNTLQVKVGIPDPPAVFKPEMLVDVTFLAPRPLEDLVSEPGVERRLYAPGQFIESGESGSFIWVADQSEGTARRVAVETGSRASNGLVEITKGLKISSRIISSDVEGLRDGQRIRVTGEADPSEIINQRSSKASRALERLPNEGGN